MKKYSERFACVRNLRLGFGYGPKMLKVDKDGSGTISLGEYFGIFEEHGINLSKSEVER